jgi:hypothetical protein
VLIAARAISSGPAKPIWPNFSPVAGSKAAVSPPAEGLLYLVKIEPVHTCASGRNR